MKKTTYFHSFVGNLLSKIKSLFFSLWKFVKFVMSLLKTGVNFHCSKFKIQGLKFVKFWSQFWNDNSSSNFASFFIFLIHDSYVNFKVIHFLLRMKESHQSPHFETFEWSGKNLPNPSSHFSNQTLVFLQISHHCLVSKNNSSVPFYLKHYILSSKGAH